MITAIMLPNLIKIGILIDFKINQDFIAKVLCINKEEPIKKCNGKCYLSKQLKKAEKQEEKHTPTNEKRSFEVVYFYYKSTFDFLSFTKNYMSNLNPACEGAFYKSSYIDEIFHPPKFYLI